MPISLALYEEKMVGKHQRDNTTPNPTGAYPPQRLRLTTPRVSQLAIDWEVERPDSEREGEINYLIMR
jgi:hypothetical protein